MRFGDFDPLQQQRVEILNPDGSLKNQDLVPPDLTTPRLLELYDRMVFLRVADQEALTLQRAGRMGTYAPTLGQEAANIGSAATLEEGDWVVPSFREMGAMLLRGVPLQLIYMYWMGSEWGSHFPENVRVLPICAPVGTQTLHGVGLAWAVRLRREANVVLIYFGDGATSKGDFHEAMNFAGVFQTPCVFFCQNNQYAISVPRAIQTAAATLAQKAIAYGFPGVIVDGNDILAVYAATQAAVAHARSGAGPVFIEAQTYRLGPHTTADDPSRYRPDEEWQTQQQYDPLLRLRRYLEKQGVLTEAGEEERLARYQTQVREVAKQAEAAISRNIDDIFAYHYATLPPYLAWQRDYLRRLLADRGEPGHG